VVLAVSSFIPVALAQPEAPKSPKVGLIVAGGVARGLSYLGVMQELVKNGVPIDSLVGTSAGALVGGLYASGYSLETTEAILREMSHHQDELIRVSFPPVRGLLDLSGFEATYRALVGGIRLEDARPRFAVMATKLAPGQGSALEKGDLASAVRASISIPFVFPPAFFEGEYYVDGGLRNPLPVNVAKALGADVVVSVRSATELPKQAQTISDTLTLTLYALTARENQEKPDASVRVPLEDTLFFDFGATQQLIERGRQAARAQMPKLLEELRAHGVTLRDGTDPNAANPINLEWRSRLEAGLDEARVLPRPFTLAPQIEFAPSSYAFGARPGVPNAFSGLGLGVYVGGGPLGGFSVAGGYVELFDQPGGSGYVTANYAFLGGWNAYGSFDPSRRPSGAPWALGLGYNVPEIGGIGYGAHLEADALAVGLGGKLDLDGPETRSSLNLEARFGYAPSLRLEASTTLEWTPTFGDAAGPWVLRGRALGGLTTGGAQGFSLGASSLLRAYPNGFAVTPQAVITNLEIAYRFEVPNLIGLASTTPELRAFFDAGLGLDVNAGRSSLLWNLGLGVTLPGRWFGFVPFAFGLDVAAGPVGWRVNLFTGIPF
jgi:NTE family protein